MLPDSVRLPPSRLRCLTTTHQAFVPSFAARHSSVDMSDECIPVSLCACTSKKVSLTSPFKHHDWFNTVLTYGLCVGLVVSYLPQHLRIIMSKSSEGISPVFLFLGVASTSSSMFNMCVYAPRPPQRVLMRSLGLLCKRPLCGAVASWSASFPLMHVNVDYMICSLSVRAWRCPPG